MNEVAGLMAGVTEVANLWRRLFALFLDGVFLGFPPVLPFFTQRLTGSAPSGGIAVNCPANRLTHRNACLAFHFQKDSVLRMSQANQWLRPAALHWPSYVCRCYCCGNMLQQNSVDCRGASWRSMDWRTWSQWVPESLPVHIRG